MSRSKTIKRLGRLFVLAVVVGIGVLAWYATRPGPLAFAGGNTMALDAYDGHPTGVPADFSATDIVSRGRYLTDAADCKACHTAEGGAAFAGGRAFKTGFGVLYSSNITPDQETGIGKYNDADFLKVVHEGVARDGKKLYPALPYESYTYIADDDVLAIKAYLFSLTPVHKVAPENALAFPFNQRFLMTFWSALFNPDHRFEPRRERSTQWNRGAYLVEGLAHCGDCHTPRNLMQGLDNQKKFAGALTGGWRAYNITADKDSGVGTWSAAELGQYLAAGHAAGRGTASGPMAEAVDLSFAKLSPADIGAMVAYLQSVPGVQSKDLPAPKREIASVNPLQDPHASIDVRGRDVFASACASCHSWTGISALSGRATLTGTRAINDPTATNVAQMVIRGTQYGSPDGRIAMPAFGAAYNDGEIAAVSNYVTARLGVQGSALTAADVRKLRAAE